MHQSRYLRNYSFLSTFSLVWWEYLTTCDDEYELIWRRPVNTIKCIFFFSRYVSLIVSTINVALLFGPLSLPHIDTSICRAWFLFMFSSSLAVYSVLEFFLIMRVYALYRQSTRVVLYFGTLMTAEIILEIYTLFMTFKYSVFRSDSCDAKELPQQVFHFSGCVLLSQFSLWYLTYIKRNVVSGAVPVIQIMTRDGFGVFVAICALVCAAVPYSSTSEYLSAHVLLNWPPVFTSVITCRMIVNLQHLNIGGTAYSAEQSQLLTTRIESLQSRSGIA